MWAKCELIRSPSTRNHEDGDGDTDYHEQDCISDNEDHSLETKSDTDLLDRDADVEVQDAEVRLIIEHF